MNNLSLRDKSLMDAGRTFAHLLDGKLKPGQGPVDLNRLHEQKMTLITVASEEREAAREGGEDGKAHAARAADLDGLIGFLDAFQDMLVDNMKIWQYPPMEDEG